MTSSVEGKLGKPGIPGYATTKHAVNGLVKAAAAEVGTTGITINAILPGIIETDIHDSGGQPERARQMAPLVPMQRAGSAEEVARAIVWLMSPEASYVTGANIDVAGGR